MPIEIWKFKLVLKSRHNSIFHWDSIKFYDNSNYTLIFLRMDVCNGICSVPAGYTSRCQQQYVQKRLVALEGSGNQLYTDVFWFPHGCACEIIANYWKHEWITKSEEILLLDKLKLYILVSKKRSITKVFVMNFWDKLFCHTLVLKSKRISDRHDSQWMKKWRKNFSKCVIYGFVRV